MSNPNKYADQTMSKRSRRQISPGKKEIRVIFTNEQCETLKRQAESLNVTRAQLIRSRALNSDGKSGNVRFDRFSYAKAVEAAAKATPGISRAQIEWTVSTVINSIAS